MPIYDMYCKKCDTVCERFEAYKDAKHGKVLCESCKGALELMLSPVASGIAAQPGIENPGFYKAKKPK
jgi:putative FmdB family regulatory protein